MRGYKKYIFIILVGVIGAELAGLALPWIYKLFIDRFTSKVLSVDEIVLSVKWILASVLLMRGVAWIANRTAGFAVQYMTSRVMTDIDQSSLHYVLGHSYQFFSDTFSGSLVKRVNRLSRSYETITDCLGFDLLPVAIRIVGTVAIVWLRSPLISVIILIWIIIFLTANYAFASWKLSIDAKRAEQDSKVTGVLSDIVTNAVTVKLFSGVKEEDARFRSVTEELRRMRNIGWNLSEVNEAMQWLFMIAIEGIVTYQGILLWQKGVITVGDFLLFQGYLTGLFGALRPIARILRRMYEALAEAKEMVDILDMPYEIKDKRKAKLLEVKKGKIEFQNVVFNYHKTRRVLDDFSLAIKPREKVALVGSSGAGKSTVVKLLFRFYDLDRGNILIDGQKISDVTQESLRNAIALVPQEPILFHRTLMENIRYGKRDATDAEVMEAARKAHCDEFISQLPLGYETHVGERGVKLSGGERQRVAIARAILKNAPILVLDEATSSLDSESESLIQDALHQLMKDKTVIVIAHRLSTIMQMDRIVVMEDGGVVDAGTHDELLSKTGIYQKLWNIQAGGFVGAS
ncbi:ABC transporter ATP-binding protein [Patescibacteria group bacterium]|nr:ABC transporter ATP-binding protein [Patescibacteria group bacterium]